MKMCINGISIKSVALAIVVAAFGFSASVAQVSVNAPSGLTKRSSAAVSGKSSSSSAPAASAPAASNPAPAKTAPAKASGAQRRAAAPSQGNGGVTVGANGSVSNQTVTGQITGYRVQVLFSSAKNGRAEGKERAKKIALKYPQYRAYMSYVAPRWRLRFGDFKTYEDARVLANLIKRAFPEWRKDVAIVTDKINKFK
ncbi:MAG: SPOR domain-containing protein [Bacteroidales bacterium]|nr:SPOR domain-containing protein [Bacteroidales bacterium]